MSRVHKAEFAFALISVCDGIERGERQRGFLTGKAQPLDGGNADADARKRTRSRHAGEKIAVGRRKARRFQRLVDLVHQQDGMLHRTVPTAGNDLPFPVDRNDVELFSACIDRQKFHAMISRSPSPFLRMVIFLQCSGKRGAMFSLHSTRQILPASK